MGRGYGSLPLAEAPDPSAAGRPPPPSHAPRVPLPRSCFPCARGCRARVAGSLRPSCGLRGRDRQYPSTPGIGRAPDLLGNRGSLAIQPLGYGGFALCVLPGPLRSRSVARLPGCSLLYTHSARTAAVHHARNDFQATHAASTYTKSAAVTCVPPNKRLKLPAPGLGTNCVCAPASSVLVSIVVAPARVGAAA